MSDQDQANILQQLQFLNGNATNATSTTLNKIYNKVDKISQAVFNMESDSASSSGSYVRDNTRLRARRRNNNSALSWNDSDSDVLNMGKQMVKSVGTFLDEFEKQLVDSLISSHFKDQLKGTFDKVAKNLGTTIDQLPQELAKRSAADWAKRVASNTRFGKYISGRDEAAARQMKSNIESRQSAHAEAEVKKLYDKIRSGPRDTRSISDEHLKILGMTRSQYSRASISEIDELLNQRQSADILKVKAALNGQSMDESVDTSSISNSISAASHNAANTSSILTEINDNVANIYKVMMFASGLDISESGDLIDRENLIGKMDKLSEYLKGSGTSSTTIEESSRNAAEQLNEVAETSGGLDKAQLNLITQTSETAGVMDLLADNASNSITSMGVATVMIAQAADTWRIASEDLKKKLPELWKSIQNSAFRTENKRLAEAENATKRMVADIQTIITEPFEILKKSAEEVWNVWDNTLRDITATQGYTKSDVQDLMAAYAARIRSEGLTNVVSGVNIIDNLDQILKSGLSGKVAEEFAYQASILKAAMPTQDFFGYASTYSSIAANAIKSGKSQDEAIKEANASLSEFANNLLYASRELAGGFSTGLKDAQSLYEQAVRITQAARGGNVSQVSGVLTSVAAIVGATAPDLATALTDAVYKAAVGGNDSSLVALRSLAGINASNTEFLRALANDPQSVFSKLFDTLGRMFTDSSDAYMEKAEGYAQLFGLSAEAFQRIDFNYLAQAISEMNISSDALADNMELLASGQTTLTQEQMKNQKINEYMIEEGLAYVLDNAAARSIQEHMWDEELNDKLIDATYDVELTGKAYETLEAIKNAVTKSTKVGLGKAIGGIIGGIVGSIIPGAGTAAGAALGASIGGAGATLISALTNRPSKSGSAFDIKSATSDIADILEQGVVGKGNAGMYEALTTYGKNQHIVPSLYQLRRSLTASRETEGDYESVLDYVLGQYNRKVIELNDLAEDISAPTSSYRWNMITKSGAAVARKLLKGLGGGFNLYSGGSSATGSYLTSKGIDSKIEQMLSDEYIKSFAESGDYAGWVASAKSKLGIADFSSAVAAAGYNESDLKQYFDDMTANVLAEAQEEASKIEYQFYSVGLEFYQTKFFGDYVKPLTDQLDKMITKEDQIIEISDKMLEQFILTNANWETHLDKLTKFVGEFSNYFLTRNQYLSKISSMNDVEEIRRKEQAGAGDAVYALAEALTANATDLKDPTLQTNALLGQILIVLNTLMQQGMLAPAAQPLDSQLTGLALGKSNQNLI